MPASSGRQRTTLRGVPLLLRSPDAALDPDSSRGLVDFAVRFIEVLSHMSAGAEVLNRGSYLPLPPGQVHIFRKRALWRNELTCSVTVNRGIVERCDMTWVARLLLEEATFQFDRLVLSSAAKDVRGLLYKIAPLSASLATDAMERDIDNLKAKLGRYAVGALFIAASAQTDVLDGYRRYAKVISNTVRRSATLPNRTVILVADDAVISGIGEPYIDANRVGLERVELRLCLPLAWVLRSADMVAWIRGTTW